MRHYWCKTTGCDVPRLAGPPGDYCPTCNFKTQWRTEPWEADDPKREYEYKITYMDARFLRSVLIAPEG